MKPAVREGSMTLDDHHERGVAMVLAIGVLAVLGLLASVILAIVVAEKRTESAAYASDRALYSADAATEAGVHWLHGQPSPAALVDSLLHVRVSQGPTALSPDHQYEFNVQYAGNQFRPGWSIEFKDYLYRVDASGTSAQHSEAVLQVNASRLYREGY